MVSRTVASAAKTATTEATAAITFHTMEVTVGLEPDTEPGPKRQDEQDVKASEVTNHFARYRAPDAIELASCPVRCLQPGQWPNGGNAEPNRSTG